MRGGDILIATLRGEVAAAVAVALALMPIAEVTLEVDLAMTAVLRGALAGDGPAALVLAHVLGHADIGHPFAAELSASWLTISCVSPGSAPLHQAGGAPAGRHARARRTAGGDVGGKA